MLPDYHLHTFLSDGKDTHEDMVASAAFKGIPEIGFTDHLCIKPVGWAMDLSNIPLMLERINEVKKDEKNPVLIKLGGEIDYIPGSEQEIADLINSIPFDFI